MGEESNKVIGIFLGLGGLAIVAALAFGLINTAKEKTDDVSNQLFGTMDVAMEREYTQYDGKSDIGGNTVKNVITNAEAKTDGVYILVKTKMNTAGVYYIYDSNGTRIDDTTHKELKKNLNQRTHNDYINPTGTFDGEAIRNDNGGLVGVVFTQQ